MRAVRILAATLALTVLMPATAIAQQAPPSLPDIEDEVMCPTCGFSLALSESPQANQIRDLIRQLIDEGLTKEQIKDALVVEYGPEVLASPETSGFDLAALKGQTVLDMGCGSGRFAIALATTGAKIVCGVDMGQRSIENAKRKLETTRDTINDITWNVGYEDIHSFRRLFRKYTGLSPKEYRHKFSHVP